MTNRPCALLCCWFLGLAGLLAPQLLLAQPDNPRNEERNYDPDLLSVRFHLRQAPLTFPVLNLKAPLGTLLLTFDRLGTDLRDYVYTIEHCNADWQRSSLNEMEYLDGFSEDRIQNAQNANNTLQPYLHYWVELPNRNMRWTQSGNYLLKVYDVTYGRQLVLVRRFVVSENTWSVSVEFMAPARVERMNTHHELNFSVNTGSVIIQIPEREVKAVVLQNARWDSAIGPMAPFIRRQNQLLYNYRDSIVFPAGKEWRYFDMRTFQFRGEFIQSIRMARDYYEVALTPDENRAYKPYVQTPDINGRFSIENRNDNQGLDQCDYAIVRFTLKAGQPFEHHDVYVYGQLTDWLLKPEFKMTYNEAQRAYVCDAYLKQGYYNYQYVLVNPTTGERDETGVEGNWYETENDYQILVYYRPLGARADRLMAFTSVKSRRSQ